MEVINKLAGGRHILHVFLIRRAISPKREDSTEANELRAAIYVMGSTSLNWTGSAGNFGE